MKRFLLLAFCVFMPSVCSAQSTKKHLDDYLKISDAILFYDICLLKAFDRKVSIIADLDPLGDAMVAECKPERAAHAAAHLHVYQSTPQIAEAVTMDFENRIIGERKAKHDIAMASARMRVVILRGAAEMCPSAKKDAALSEAERYVKALPNIDAASKNVEYFKAELDKSYQKWVTDRVTQSGKETWCRDRKAEADNAGIGKDFFN